MSMSLEEELDAIVRHSRKHRGHEPRFPAYFKLKGESCGVVIRFTSKQSARIAAQEANDSGNYTCAFVMR